MNAIFITVRTNSTRLPNKCLLPINDKRVIDLVIERAKLARKADKIILCTTINEEDNILEEIAIEHNIDVFRGSVKDKLERWNQAAKKFNITNIVTFDADDLFCDPVLINIGFSELENNDIDFITPGDICCGIFTYAIKAKALDDVCKIKDTDDTEMMWTYFTDTGLFKTAVISAPPDLFNKKIRLTLDYKEDYELFKLLYKIFNINTFVYEIIKFLEDYPQVADINYYRQEQYLNNQKEKTILKLKNEKSI